MFFYFRWAALLHFVFCRSLLNVSERVVIDTGGWSGTDFITVGNPHTGTGIYAEFGVAQVAVGMIFQDWIHSQGGIIINNKAYGLRIVNINIGGNGSETNADLILSTNAAMDAMISRNVTGGIEVDFYMTPYSTPLTIPAGAKCTAAKKVCMGWSAASVSVYKCDGTLQSGCSRPLGLRYPYMFGFLQPTTAYFEVTLSLLKVNKARTIATIYDNTGAFGRELQQGLEDMVTGFDLVIAYKYAYNYSNINDTTIAEIKNNLIEVEKLNVDGLIVCTLIPLSIVVSKQLIAIDFSPKLTAYAASVGTKAFLDAVGVEAAAYNVGPTAWATKAKGPLFSDSTPFPFRSNTDSTASDQFTKEFRDYVGADPPAQASGLLRAYYCLHKSLSLVQTTTAETILQAIGSLSFTSAVGPVRFDKNQMLDSEMLMTQYNENGTVEIISPASSLTSTLHYPAPTIRYRRCVNSGYCINGQCSVDGRSCSCSIYWKGERCDISSRPIRFEYFLIFLILPVIILGGVSYRYYKERAKRQAMIGESVMVARVAEDIATMKIEDSLATLTTIAKPTKIHLSLIKVCFNLKEVKNYIPATLLAEMSGEQASDESEGKDAESTVTPTTVQRGKRRLTYKTRRENSTSQDRDDSTDRSSNSSQSSFKLLMKANVAIVVLEVVKLNDLASHESFGEFWYAWLTAMLKVSKEQKGIMDHLFTNKMMVSFNLYSRCPSPALRACEFAIGMQDEFDRIQALHDGTVHNLTLRCVISTGSAQVGHIGCTGFKKVVAVGSVLGSTFGLVIGARINGVVCTTDVASQANTQFDFALCTCVKCNDDGVIQTLWRMQRKPVREEGQEWMYSLSSSKLGQNPLSIYNQIMARALERCGVQRQFLTHEIRSVNVHSEKAGEKASELASDSKADMLQTLFALRDVIPDWMVNWAVTKLEGEPFIPSYNSV